MSNKTLLVAQREYMENIRTKMFWIGILFVPILIVGSIGVSAWLQKKKDTRTYAVIDESGWLLKDLDERAAMPDLKAVFRTAIQWHKDADERFATLPASIQSFARDMAADLDKGFDALPAEVQAQVRAAAGKKEGEFDLQDYLLDTVVKSFSVDGPESGMASLEALSGKLDLIPEEYRVQVREFLTVRGEVRTWWKNLPPEEAGKFGKEISKSRYLRRDFEGSGETAIEQLNQDVADKKLFAYFIIGKDPVDGDAGCKYVSNNLTDNDLKRWFGGVATDVVREKRLEEEAIDPQTAEHIQRPLSFESKKVSKTGEEEKVDVKDRVRQMAPIAFVYVLWLAIFSIAQMLLTNTIEEKSNRILEVLLSSISPLQLMMGKIFGICLTGLTVITSWVIYFALAVRFVPKMMGVDTNINLSSIAGDPTFILSFLVYFTLGYLLFATCFVGIGSVCNSVKEASNLMMPVTLMLMLPLMSMIPISQDPNGRLARVLSFIPPFTPFVMMNRAAGPPAMWEYVTTTVLLVVSILVSMWAAAKVFRIGILMTGKPPSPLEIVKWLRAPVGQVPTRE